MQKYQPIPAQLAVQDQPAQPQMMALQTRDAVPTKNELALEKARARAAESKIQLLKQPDMLNGEELGKELNLSRATIDNRRVNFKLLALEFGSKRGFRYPLWQRDLLQERETREAFEAALGLLAKVGQWSRYRFFVQAAPSLDGHSPIEALRAGRAAAVLRAAQTWVQAEQGGG